MPAFGHELMSFDIRVERHLDVTPGEVFHHWTDDEARRDWYCGDEDNWVVHSHNDLRVGGRFVVRWGPTAEDAFQEAGTFEVIDQPRRPAYTSRFTPRTPDEGDPFQLHVTVTFDPDGDGTLLTLVESGYPTEGIRDAFLRDGAAQGLEFFDLAASPNRRARRAWGQTWVNDALTLTSCWGPPSGRREAPGGGSPQGDRASPPRFSAAPCAHSCRC